MPEAAANPPLPARGTVLGFDFGTARIGVAVGELETRQASALTTITAATNEQRFGAIGKLVAEWRPVAMVVGIPCHLDGTEHELTVRCRRFANQLHGRFALPVHPMDERLTSTAAEAALNEAGRRGGPSRKPQIDAVAAQIILQDFLNGPAHATS